jgi:hypothetical protein
MGANDTVAQTQMLLWICVWQLQIRIGALLINKEASSSAKINLETSASPVTVFSAGSETSYSLK